MTMTLKELRINKGMNGSELAAKAGIVEPLYSMMENGKRNISVKSAKKLAPLLDVEWHELVELNEVHSNDTQ